MQVPAHETIKAWTLLIVVLFVITVISLYGWPKYQGYKVVEAAKAEIEIGALKFEANEARARAIQAREEEKQAEKDGRITIIGH